MQYQTQDRNNGFYISPQLKDALDELIVEERHKNIEGSTAKNEGDFEEKDRKN